MSINTGIHYNFIPHSNKKISPLNFSLPPILFYYSVFFSFNLFLFKFLGMSSSPKEGKGSSVKNEDRVGKCEEKDLRKSKTVRGETSRKKTESRTKIGGEKKTKPTEPVLPYDPTHKCLTDPTRRLKKRKKKFYSPLAEGAARPDYTPESSYDYSTSSASDGYSPSSDAESRA